MKNYVVGWYFHILLKSNGFENNVGQQNMYNKQNHLVYFYI
jgi:hypothetical protein